jgi:hypothetical protein
MQYVKLLCSLGLLFGGLVSATPILQIHVFDENAQVEQTVTSKHSLQMHVYTKVAGVESTYPPLQQHQQAPPVKSSPLFFYDRAEMSVRSGYRKDDLDWNIAGVGGVPNILSELTWNDLEIAEVKVSTRLYTQDNWIFGLDAGYGHIFNGNNQDSDYLGNNRSMEFSRSNNSADEGEVYDISLSAGYRYLWQHKIKANQYSGELRPLVGVSYHAQNLKSVEGYQTIPVLGSFSGLDSSYDASWFGPWLGVEGLLSVNQYWTFSAGIEYHYAWYDATANWNLRTDFAHPESFTHEAQGMGLVTKLGGKYQFRDDLSVDLSLNYQDWRAAKNGKDRTFFANGAEVEIRLNEINWNSFAANLGLNYSF